MGRARKAGTVAELFAGVGGFRLGLERSGWQVVWSNQFEPSTKGQHASDCYVARFGPEGHVNRDIAEVVAADVPDVDLLVGGFPCQDYSVAKTLNQAHGIEGKKGVLWWEIERFLAEKRPRMVFLENVDRLLKSPASQRGRDFAIILNRLDAAGYSVEWRVVNAADYGFPQRRRRVMIVGTRSSDIGSPADVLHESGVLARALPVYKSRGVIDGFEFESFGVDGDVTDVSAGFGIGDAKSRFRSAGLMRQGKVWTGDLRPKFGGVPQLLADILVPEEEVPDAFFIPSSELAKWKYLKGPKNIPRVSRSGVEYLYSEGGIAFPDALDQPSRTILTGEGGATPSRFKHIIKVDRRHRRLTPIELERLNGFPDNWTDTGMPDGRRAFMMGNALVVGLVERIGRVVAAELAQAPVRAAS